MIVINYLLYSSTTYTYYWFELIGAHFTKVLGANGMVMLRLRIPTMKRYELSYIYCSDLELKSSVQGCIVEAI